MAAIPLFIAPGAGCAPRGWERFVAAVSKERSCTVLDYRDLDSIADMTDRALAVAPEKFILLGHSMGGYVALNMALRAPQRIEKLVLANTQATADSPAQVFARRQETDGGEDRYNARFANDAEVLRTASPSLPDRYAALEVLLDSMTDFACHARHQDACIERADLSGELKTIYIPTLVIAGEHDAKIPPSRQIEIAHAMPHAQLRILTHCGHNPQAEQPAAFAKMVTEFTLKRSYTPGGGTPAP